MKKQKLLINILLLVVAVATVVAFAFSIYACIARWESFDIIRDFIDSDQELLSPLAEEYNYYLKYAVIDTIAAVLCGIGFLASVAVGILVNFKLPKKENE